MKIVIAPDSFKGSLSAVEATDAITAGVRRVRRNVEIIAIPLADGGEGTIDAWIRARGGRHVTHSVRGPLGESIDASYGVLDGEPTTIVIESAAASGLTLVAPDRRNPLLTTTYGTGELISHAVGLGTNTQPDNPRAQIAGPRPPSPMSCRRLIIGLGGSATNDCGAGALQALGWEFWDANGLLIPSPMTGGDLITVARIRAPKVGGPFPTVVLASDVMNPLTGPNGASAIYGPQKGATPEMVTQLDRGLAHFAEVIKRDVGPDIANIPGAGAAGGLGGALMAFFGATAQSGIDLLLDAAGFDEAIQDADFVITGEGSIDRQTLSGKTIAGVLRRCRGGKPRVLAVGGVVDVEITAELRAEGIADMEAAAPLDMPRDEAMRRAAEFVEEATERLMQRTL